MPEWRERVVAAIGERDMLVVDPLIVDRRRADEINISKKSQKRESSVSKGSRGATYLSLIRDRMFTLLRLAVGPGARVLSRC